MNLQFRNQVLLFACMALSNIALANDGHSSPSYFTANRFIASLKTFDAMNTANASAKVCACQILNLHSNNHHFENVVVFAEKSYEDEHTDMAKAINRLEKEKQQLKQLFYTRVNVVAKTTAATDCNSLYLQLKKKNSNLKVYETLNADVAVK